MTENEFLQYDLQQAHARVAWRKSPQAKAARRWGVLEFLTGFVAVAGAVVLISIFLFDIQIDRSWGLVLILTSAAFLSLYVSVGGVRRRLREDFQDEQRLMAFERLRREELQDVDEPGELETARMWASTQRRIDYYHEIALRQARQSYLSGQISAYIGFSVVVAAAGLAAFSTSGTAAVAASVVGVAGAGLSGYIGATFMKSQAEASAQMREFFLQPVETSRMLNAERLVQTINDDAERSKAVQEIVKAMMTPRPSKDS